VPSPGIGLLTGLQRDEKDLPCGAVPGMPLERRKKKRDTRESIRMTWGLGALTLSANKGAMVTWKLVLPTDGMLLLLKVETGIHAPGKR